MLRAMLPHQATRRRFLHAVGGAAVASALAAHFPLGAATALAAEPGPLERSKLTIGFVPITCTVPLLAADAFGHYRREGLEVRLVRTPGWALVRDKLTVGEFDLSHLIAPMPLGMSLGLAGPPVATHVAAVQNLNGDALVLANKHKGRRDPKDWKGMRFGIPFEQSPHNLLLRYYLAEHGLDPDRDVELRVFAPPDSVANLRSGNLDGMLFAEPWGQRAIFEGVGFFHLLSSEIWPGHPCCVLGVTDRFMTEAPNSYGAFFRAFLAAMRQVEPMENRAEVATALAVPNYLDQPVTVLQQVLLGRFADGLGGVRSVPDRISFQPFPYEAMGVWLMTQMKRWGYISGEVDYRSVAARVFLATDAKRRMQEAGFPPPPPAPQFAIMGKPFNPLEPEAYLNSFAIRRG